MPKVSAIEKLKAELEGTAQIQVSVDANPSSDEDQYYLEFLGTSEKGKFITLNSKFIIGRDQGSYHLKHPSISNNHCSFFCNNGVLSLVDNGSTNGTLVLGKKIKPGHMMILEDGDQITIGQIDFKVVLKNPNKIKESQISKGISQKSSEKKSLEKLKSFFGKKKTKLELAVSSETSIKEGFFSRIKSLLNKKKETLEAEEIESIQPKEQAQKRNFFMGLLAKLKSKTPNEQGEKSEKAPPKKLSVVPKATKSPKMKFKNHNQNAGPLIRIWALAGDIVLVLLLCSWFESTDEGKLFFETLTGLGPKYIATYLSPYLSRFEMLEFAADIYSFIPYVTALIVTSIVGVLFFGVSTSQFILGIRPTSSILWSRVGGVLRVILGFITAPFLVFDLSCLFGFKTIKEYVTFTSLSYDKNGFKVVVALIYSAIIIPAYLFYPVLKDFDFIDGIDVHVTKIKQFVPDTSVLDFGFSSGIKFQSRLFKLFTQYKPSGRFQLMPRFEINKKGKSLSYDPSLLIYDVNKDVKGEMSVLKQFSIREILLKAKRLNPLFAAKYPQIMAALDDPPATWQQGIELKDNSEKAWINFQTESQKDIKNELEDLFLKSINLGITEIITQDKSLLPLVKSFAIVREELFKILGFPEKPYLEKIKLGNLEFLRFTLKKDSKFLVGQATFREVYLPLGVKSGMLFEINWDRVSQYEKITYEFMSEFFSNSSWVIDLKGPFPIPNPEEKNYTVFSILDYFVSARIRGDQRESLENFIYEYFYQLSQLAIKSKKDRFRLYIQGTLKRYNTIMEIALKGKNRPKRKAFQDRINDLYINLREMNHSYFALDTNNN